MKRCMAIHVWLVLLMALSFSACSSNTSNESTQTETTPPEMAKAPHTGYYDLGEFHQKATTDSEEAQLWFDRGLAMCVAFNHEEAVRCFDEARRADPTMAMAAWGKAYALGPNINNLEIENAQIVQAHMAVGSLNWDVQKGTDLEKALIGALAKRYANPAPDITERQPLNVAYSDAMREIYAQHKEDPLVASLFAESLMILRPWNHWSKEGQPAAETPEIMAVLEAALTHSPDYPALCHQYIHTMEASPTPEVALPAANRLRDAMPGAGHLVHMPSHIDVLVGDYEKVITTNQRAIEQDIEFLKREGPNNFYSLYRIHNYHFLVYGAMFDGQSALAMETARAIPKQVPQEMLLDLTDYLDAFIPTPLHVMVRFGQWDDILKEPEPAGFLPVSRSVWRYARALAYAATGRVEEAKVEQAGFARMRSTVPETSILFNNTSRDILGVAEAMIAGEIAYRQGDYDVAFTHLRESVRLDDALNYDEPWGWMQPARHALGALLLEQKHYADAEAVYRNDLQRHPNNVWALHGLADCLDKQGQSEAAAQIREQFKSAATRCDVKVDRSCYCKTMDL